MSRTASHFLIFLVLGSLGWMLGRRMRAVEPPTPPSSAVVDEPRVSENARRLDDYRQRLETLIPLRGAAPDAVRLALSDPAAAALAAKNSGDPQAVMILARALALEPPPALAAFLAHAADTPETRSLLHGEAIAWAFCRDAARGLAQLTAVSDEKAQAAHATKALHFFPPKDLPAVRAWYEQLPGGRLRCAAAAQLLPVLARQDFPAALALAAALPRDEDEGGFRREQLANLIMQSAPASTPEEKEKLLTGLPREDAEFLQGRIRAAHFDALRGYDKEGAVSFLAELPEKQRSGATRQLFEEWARADPLRAMEGFAQLPEVSKTPEVIADFARHLTATNVTRASEWVSHQAAGPLRDAAIGGLIDSLREKYPEEAFTWAASVTDPARRLAALRDTMAALPPEPPEARRARLDARSLSADDKAALLTPPSPPE